MGADKYIMCDTNGEMICGGDTVLIVLADRADFADPVAGVVIWYRGMWVADCEDGVKRPLAMLDESDVRLDAKGLKGSTARAEAIRAQEEAGL